MSPPPLILCDHREERSGIPRRLIERGCAVDVQALVQGDYVVSAALAVERKAPRDLVDSLLSGRLYRQLEALCDTFEYGLLLIEGDSWAGDRRLKTPILGRLHHWVSHRPNLSVIYSPSEAWSARILHDLARREQSETAHAPSPGPLATRTARTPRDVLLALPGVGEAGAQKLFARHGTLRAVINATRTELQATLGPNRGSRLFELLNGDQSEAATAEAPDAQMDGVQCAGPADAIAAVGVPMFHKRSTTTERG